jgi:transposase-like protein
LDLKISIENFSLSQLITSVKVVFDTEALPGFLKAFVSVVEMMALKAKLPCPKCQSEKQHVHGVSSKKLRTSIGEVSLVLTRVKCQNCGKTFIPMNRYFDLDQHSRKSREFEKLTLETITEQSFRRSEKLSPTYPPVGLNQANKNHSRTRGPNRPQKCSTAS